MCGDMKKIVIRDEKKLYVFKRVKAMYCDFCGDREVTVFESEFEDPPESRQSNICMQICFECVRQLSKLLPK